MPADADMSSAAYFACGVVLLILAGVVRFRRDQALAPLTTEATPAAAGPPQTARTPRHKRSPKAHRGGYGEVDAESSVGSTMVSAADRADSDSEAEGEQAPMKLSAAAAVGARRGAGPRGAPRGGPVRAALWHRDDELSPASRPITGAGPLDPTADDLIESNPPPRPSVWQDEPASQQQQRPSRLQPSADDLA